jgi:methylmalonyl-CoA mutase C-terminal domain/subunit
VQLRLLGSGGLPIFVGGTIPDADREALSQLGVKGIFTSAMKLDDVVNAVAEALQ